MPADACPECGAPLGSGPTEGSDAAIYPELARVNLLRNRGELKAAQDHCRNILRSYPNNVTANQLMGDLAYESGDLSQAKEWYELALDIAPSHTQILKKLRDVRQQIEQKETKSLVDQIGLPASKPKTGWMAAGLAVLVIGVGVIAYILGTQKQPEGLSAPTTSSIQAPVSTPPAVSTSEPAEPTSEQVNATSTPSGPADEAALLQLLRQRSQNNSKLMSLVIDPRTSLATVTFQVAASDDRRAIAAEIAGVTLENSPSTRIVTLRAVQDNAVVYVADARREAYEETKAEGWASERADDPAAIPNHILGQEWTSQPETGSTPPNNAAAGQ